MLIKNSDKIKPFPIYVYLGVVLILTVCGILVSGYLVVSHYRVYTDIDYSSFCAISKAINCDTVSQSRYSIFSGVPVSIWGIIGYVFFLITLLFSFNIKEKKINLFYTLFLTGMFFSAVSIFLGVISAVKIHSYCIMCIVTYAINFMLLYMIWLMKRRFENNSWKSVAGEDIAFWKANRLKAIKYYLPLIAVVVLIMLFIPDYWNLSYTDAAGVQNLNTGFTEDGSPWIGAENPELTIIEYSDYRCFQCKKMHLFLRNLIGGHPGKIRLVHKHFPLDKEFNPVIKENFHSGSGILSLIAIYAAKENKFWELNDFLYRYKIDGAIYLRDIALESGLDLDKLTTAIHRPGVRRKLQNDIISGMKKNISATPSYVINNKIYTGQIPSNILNAIRK